MKPYKQEIEGSPRGFTYEYWWAKQPHMVSCRLLKVIIPPTQGACSDWDYEFETLECLGKYDHQGDIYSQEEMGEWSWIERIKTPTEKGLI